MKCINKFKFVALFNLLQILDNKLFLNATITMQNYIGSIKTETKHALFFFSKVSNLTLILSICVAIFKKNII